MKVSIIVPIYNIPEIPLRECIESLLNQTYGNIEILLINDGSTNNCENICKEYCCDSRIRFINKENGGVSSARNMGIHLATGEYIMFVDADDRLTLNAIQIMIEEISRTKVDILICGYKRFVSYNKNLDIISNDRNTKVFENSNELVKLRQKCLHEDNILGIRFNGAPWGKLYSNKIIKENNLYFDTSLVRSQDNYFNFIIFYYVKKVGYIDLPLYLYRYIPTSSVNKFRNNLFEISQQYLSKVNYRIKEENITLEFSNTFRNIKVEKFSEYISTYFAHPQNPIPLNQKIKELKQVENIWRITQDREIILKNLDSYRTKLLYRFVFNKQYSIAYFYIKTLKFIKSIIFKFK